MEQKEEIKPVKPKAGWIQISPDVNPEQDRVPREASAVVCDCGGVAERVTCTSDELKKYNCKGRAYACCARAFVCKKCGARYAGEAFAPDCEW